MTRTWRGRPLLVWVLSASLAFLGLRGVAGGGQFLLVPSGRLVGLAPAALAGSPFETYLVPGLVLFAVLGLGSLVAAYALFRGVRRAWLAALAVAVALAVWVVVEGLVIGFGERLQYPNLLQAIATAALSVAPPVRAYCDR